MKFPVIPLVCMALLLPLPLSGQEAVQDNGPEDAEISGEGPVFFPVYALLSALGTAELRWRPDWPVAMPPDAFIVGNGRPRSVTIMTDSGELRAARDQNGSPLDFPFFFQGDFVQVHADFEETLGIRSLTIDEPPISWSIDFPEGDDPALRIARISRGDDFFFGAIQETSTGDVPGGIETWYDRDGNPLAVFTFRFTRDGQGILRVQSYGAGEETTEEQYWDSFGNTSGIVSGKGVFSAAYAGEGRPRYWERRIPADFDGEEDPPPDFRQFYTFQWDERGLLVRLTGTPGPEEEDAVDFRYEYTLDERGNWIERREIRMIPRFGMLVPGPGSLITRRIEYEVED